MPALPTGYTGTALLGQDDPAASSGEDHGNSEEMGAALGKGEMRNKRSSGRGGGRCWKRDHKCAHKTATEP